MIALFLFISQTPDQSVIMPKNINELINHVLPPTAHWKIALLNNWTTIIGDLCKQVQLEKIDGDSKLILGVYNTIWIQELYFLSNMILDKINATLEYPHIKQLHFKYSPPKKKINKKKGGTATTKKEIILTTREQHALNRINDPELRHALEIFFKRCRQGESDETFTSLHARNSERTNSRS